MSEGSSSSGSMVRGMVSPIGGKVTVDLDWLGANEGRAAFGRTTRGLASSTLTEVVAPASGKPDGPDSDRLTGTSNGIGKNEGGELGGRDVVTCRAAGAVTPGIASMGRFSVRGRSVGATSTRGGGGGVSRLVAGPLAGGSSEGGSSGGASCAGVRATSISHNDRVFTAITTSLIIAGTRLDSSLDARGSTPFHLSDRTRGAVEMLLSEEHTGSACGLTRPSRSQRPYGR